MAGHRHANVVNADVVVHSVRTACCAPVWQTKIPVTIIETCVGSAKLHASELHNKRAAYSLLLSSTADQGMM